MKFNDRNVHVGRNVKLGRNIKLGDNTIIYDNVEIGDDSVICNNCVIGEPLNDYYINKSYENPETRIGKGTLIRSHTIIYAHVITGDNFSTGHRVTIREHSRFGDGCRVGTLTDIQGFVEFGDYCWLHSNIFIAQNSKIGNFVFIYPGVIFTNDPHPPSNVNTGPVIGDFSQISAGAIIFPGIKIGKNCLIGAGSIVTKDIDDFSVVFGSPANYKYDVGKIESREKQGVKHYPWMNNFKRGMPWQGIGFELWKNAIKKK
jgi:acetyltransferase-like isoleucine patch superfamily enzyme